jgi:hypothetical protein
MNGSSEPLVSDGQLVAYLDDELTYSEQAALTALLAESAASRHRLQRLRALRARLQSQPADVGELDLVAAVHRSLADRRRARLRRATARAYWLSLACAACAVLATGVERERSVSDIFREKAALPGAARTRWAGIKAYRGSGRGGIEPLEARLARDDGLAFSYTNFGARPFQYMMIFGIDARHIVHWFHPGYEDEATDPASIELQSQATDVPLPELIHHTLPPGRLAIYALFSDSPWHVSEVERWVSKQTHAEVLLAPEGGELTCVETSVEP